MAQHSGRFLRLVDQDRPPIQLLLDGAPIEARQGDTVLTAILAVRRDLRRADWGDGARAGFCLMAACQDCWIWTQDGARLRACSTLAAAGMVLHSSSPV